MCGANYKRCAKLKIVIVVYFQNFCPGEVFAQINYNLKRNPVAKPGGKPLRHISFFNLHNGEDGSGNLFFFKK